MRRCCLFPFFIFFISCWHVFSCFFIYLLLFSQNAAFFILTVWLWFMTPSSTCHHLPSSPITHLPKLIECGHFRHFNTYSDHKQFFLVKYIFKPLNYNDFFYWIVIVLFYFIEHLYFYLFTHWAPILLFMYILISYTIIYIIHWAP